MPWFKTIFQYTQVQKGWSEIFYRFGDTIASVSSLPTSVITASLRCRHPLTVFSKYRVSEVSNNRNALPVSINRNRTTSATSPPDITGASAVVTIVSTAIGARRQLWLRGLVDDDVVRSNTTGADTPTAALQSNIDNYLSILAFTGFALQALKKLGTPPLVSSPIQSITVTGIGYVTLTMAPTWAITGSGRVILSQIDQKLFPGLTGAFKATQVATLQFTVPYNSHLAQATYGLTKGKSRPQEFDYGVINAALSDFSHFTTRDTGRNPLGGRGRRSARSLRSA